ncbi:MAG: C39 family peptidase [Elusimicrobiota bacterium]|nr:C39 family peptidase [Elusimicrobiota bacterium]
MNHTVVLRTPLDTAKVKAAGLKRLPFSDGLFETVGATATLESADLESPFPFDDLVASLAAAVPDGGEAELSARVRFDSGWSEWYPLGTKRADGFYSPEAYADENGKVDVDTLKLKSKATAARLRVRFKAGKRPVRLIQAAVAVSDGDAPSAPPPFLGGAAVRDLGVSPRSQGEAQDKYKHDICSPTSLSMVLDFWGEKTELEALAEEVRDKTSQLFGNWPANAAAAGDRGLPGFVARLESLNDLEREVAAGRPVVVSVTAKEGELPGAPYKKTNGHLLVVGGFTETGEVVAYDPAGKPRDQVRRVYGREAFHQVWRVRKRGLAYVIGPDFPRRLTVGVPVADLWSKPVKRDKPTLDDAAHLTQLLYGEVVTALEARDDGWVRVRAEEQDSFLPAGAWQGYPGWLRAEQLVSAPPPEGDVVVRTRQTLLQRGDDITPLSVGTRLKRVSESNGASFVRLLDGSLAEVPSDALYVAPSSPTAASRAEIIRAAELFLGTSYYWGGRAGVQPDPKFGVDCSGLVSLAYRIHGRDVPRDSHEQKLKSRPLRREELQSGDLVFLTESDVSDRITHVMIHTGGDGLIESRKSSGRVLRTTFLERFGKPLTAIESGDALTDLSFPKPRRRRIFFGSYF